MTTSTLRTWGGAIAVSLPKKILGLLGLKAGSEVEIKVENGKIVLLPAPPRFSLEQLEKEQRALERKLGGPLGDPRWLQDGPQGRESL